MGWISVPGSSEPIRTLEPAYSDFLLTTASSFQFCIGVPKMRTASRPSAGLTPLASDFHVEQDERSIFASIILALHSSRQLQARRILRQYAHLIAGGQERIRHELNQRTAGRKPSVTGRPDPEKSAARPPATGEMGWLVAVALAFLLVHIAAGTIWGRTSAKEATTTGQEALSSFDD